MADEKKRGGAWGWDWSFGWGAVPGVGRGGGIPASITAQPRGPRVRDIPGPIDGGNGGPFGARGRAERGLVVAMLAQAQDDLRNATHRGKAVAWVVAPPLDWPFSFENCCHYVELDPGRVRAAWGVGCPAGDAATKPQRHDTFRRVRTSMKGPSLLGVPPRPVRRRGRRVAP